MTKCHLSKESQLSVLRVGCFAKKASNGNMHSAISRVVAATIAIQCAHRSVQRFREVDLDKEKGQLICVA